MSRYPVPHLPWEVQAKKVQEDLASLNANLNRLQREFAEESQQRQYGREKILGVVFNGYEQVRKSYYSYYDRYCKRK